MLFNDNEDIA